MLNLEDIQVIVVSSFFEQMDQPYIKDLFGKLLVLKRDGYKNHHSNRYLPVSTHDFFGTHLILCEKKSMTPILCSKIVSFKSCLYYNTSFPLSGMSDVFSLKQQKAVDDIIRQRVQKGRDLSYSGGLTINPLFKGEGQSPLFKDIYTGLHYLLHRDHGLSTMMGFAIPKVGTDRFFKTWGVRPLIVDGEEMKPTPLPFANNADTILVWGDLEDLSEYKIQMGEKYSNLWKNRLEFLVPEETLVAA